MPRVKTQRLWLCLWRSHSRNDVAAASRGFSRPHRCKIAERRFPTRKAIQRLGLCRFGVPATPEPPPAKRQDFVLAWAIRFAGDVAARTYSVAATSPSATRRPCSTSHLRPESADCRDRTHPRGQPKTSCFLLRHKRQCSPLQNPKTLALPVAIRHRPPMSPLRAVVSRGHIALRQSQPRREFALSPSRHAMPEFARLRPIFLTGILPGDETADTM